MLIRLRETGALCTDHEFRSAHANTSFPPSLGPELLDSYGADPVLDGPQPALGRYQVSAMQGARQDGDNWITNWVAVDMSPEACQALDARTADAMRAERNARLSASDWTQLPDAPVDRDAWAAYRTALRSLPQHPGFPWDVEWPTPPL